MNSWIAIAIDWIYRLIPAMVLLSLAFALDGGLRWLGLLGVPAMFLALSKDCPRCGPQSRTCGAGRTSFHSWPGH